MDNDMEILIAKQKVIIQILIVVRYFIVALIGTMVVH